MCAKKNARLGLQEAEWALCASSAHQGIETAWAGRWDQPLGKQGLGSGEHRMVKLPPGIPGRAGRGSTGSGFEGPWEPCGAGTGPPCHPQPQQFVPSPVSTCRGQPGLSCSLRAAHFPGKEVPGPSREGSVGTCSPLCVCLVCHGVGRKGLPWNWGPAVLGIACK